MIIVKLIALIFLLCLTTGLLLRPIFLRWIKLYRWSRQLGLNRHRKAFEKLYQSINGFELSKKARIGNNAPEYIYGEIEFTPFTALMSTQQPDVETVFYDLGSGTGKAAIAMAMVFNIKKSYGIELFELLHQKARQVKKAMDGNPDYQNKRLAIEFKNQNFLETNLSDATLVFINATTLIGPVWANLCQNLTQTVKGTKIITTSKSIKNEHFKVIHSYPIKMSWGIVTAYIHLRI